jgi:hypothetical protein
MIPCCISVPLFILLLLASSKLLSFEIISSNLYLTEAISSYNLFLRPKRVYSSNSAALKKYAFNHESHRPKFMIFIDDKVAWIS